MCFSNLKYQEALLKKMAADMKQRLRDERKAAKAATAAAAKAAAELDPDYDSEDDVANAADDEEEEEEEEEPGLLTFKKSQSIFEARCFSYSRRR